MDVIRYGCWILFFYTCCIYMWMADFPPPLLLCSELNSFTSKLQSCSHKSIRSERYLEERCSPLTSPMCSYIVINPSTLSSLFCWKRGTNAPFFHLNFRSFAKVILCKQLSLLIKVRLSVLIINFYIQKSQGFKTLSSKLFISQKDDWIHSTGHF